MVTLGTTEVTELVIVKTWEKEILWLWKWIWEEKGERENIPFLHQREATENIFLNHHQWKNNHLHSHDQCCHTLLLHLMECLNNVLRDKRCSSHHLRFLFVEMFSLRCWYPALMCTVKPTALKTKLHLDTHCCVYLDCAFVSNNIRLRIERRTVRDRSKFHVFAWNMDTN